MKKPSDRRYILLAVILGLATTGLCLAANRLSTFPGDLGLTLDLQSFNNAAFADICKGLAWAFGDWHAALLVFPAGLLVGWRFDRRAGLAVWVAGFISLANEGLKHAVGRPRPLPSELKILVEESGSAFPSGHAFFATVFVGFLAYLLFTRLTNPLARVCSLVLLIALILLVGISRVYVGVHWPSDVIGGYVAGGFFLTLLIWSYRRLSESGSRFGPQP